MRCVYDGINVEVNIQNNRSRNVYLFLGDFFNISHYEIIKLKLLNEKYNIFIFEYSKNKSEQEYCKSFLSIYDQLNKEYNLLGDNVLIGHSKGAHIVMLMSQELGDCAKYILLNPFLRVRNAKTKINRRLYLECLQSIIMHREIRLSYKTFVDRFIDKDVSNEKMKKIYESSIPIGIKEYLFPMVLKEYKANSYVIIYSVEDKAIDSYILMKKIKYLEERWKLKIVLYSWDGGHCKFMFSDNENTQKLLKIINILNN